MNTNVSPVRSQHDVQVKKSGFAGLKPLVAMFSFEFRR
jgi:hypothetical protein